jgi:hypothetical protein
MRRYAGALAAIVIALALGVWIYQWYRIQSSRDAVVASIRDTSERLRASWPRETGESAVDFEAHARAVETHVRALRKMNTSSMRELGDAADDYLVTAREILRRQSAIRGSRERLSKDVEILARHLRSDRGRPAWPQQAVRLKSAVDTGLRDYRIASESYASLLKSLPASQSKVAPYLDRASIVDENAAKDAGARALDALARTDENIRQLTRLDVHRGGRAAIRR